MRTIFRSLLGFVGILIPALLTPTCYAQCGGPRPAHTGLSTRTAQTRLLFAAFLPVADEDWGRDRPAIVGFWHQQLISEGSTGIPDGQVVDDDLAQWHSDNTEIQNTKSRTPPSANFCLGVWQQTGPRSFKLNHFPQAFDPTGTVFVGTAQLQEDITVSPDGNTYSRYRGSYLIPESSVRGPVSWRLETRRCKAPHHGGVVKPGSFSDFP